MEINIVKQCVSYVLYSIFKFLSLATRNIDIKPQKLNSARAGIFTIGV